MSQLVNKERIPLFDPESPMTEMFRTLRTNIKYAMLDEVRQVIAIVSSLRGEGKTMIASNLAVSYAQEGKRVLLIDANLRIPSLHKVFSQANKIGLTNILIDGNKWQETVRDTIIENLQLLCVGSIPYKPSELLGSERMSLLLDELRGHYDVILIDTPSILAVSDGLVIGKMCDAAVLVIDSERTDKSVVKKTKSNLDHLNIKLVGCVLNRHSDQSRY